MSYFVPENMPKSIPSSLSKEDIEEELINNDLMESGGLEDHDHLNQMNLEEKRNLMRTINQSKEDFDNEVSTKSPNQPIVDITNQKYANVAGKNNTGSYSKLKLPRKVGMSPSSKELFTDKNLDSTLFLTENEPERSRFTLPYCVDDGAPPLPLPDRPLLHDESPYYVTPGESPAAAVKRMLAHHDHWKHQYQAEINRIESHALGEDTDEKEQRDSPRSECSEEKENDIYKFSSDSPVRVSPKFYTGPRKKDTNKITDVTLQSGSRTLQRTSSRDSDCEEVELTSRPEDPKLSDWITPRTRGKRNRKQMMNHEQRQTESSPNVEFDFDNKWDSRSSTWSGRQTPGPSSLNNQTAPRRSVLNTPVVEEKKVQCPICQRNFAQSKVETHAATCEGYSESGSPMDVEEES